MDLLSPKWNEKHVLKLMASKKDTFLCDLFLDQTLFAGSGNIVKNEVLFNIRRHPLTKLSQIEKGDWPKLVHAVRDYCFNFYDWKKKFELRQHWQVYRKLVCPVCKRKVEKMKVGKLNRMNFICPHCQNKRQRLKKFELFDVLPIGKVTGSKERLDH
ncbi:MAG: hypothetical protein H0V66_12635 [Bdellovibrionales bacterium]|nr:hypothetical protein [Bdellovibrionales bacterium]